MHHTLPEPTRHTRERTTDREMVYLFVNVVYLRLPALLVCLCPGVLLCFFIFPILFLVPSWTCAVIRTRLADISLTLLCSSAIFLCFGLSVSQCCDHVFCVSLGRRIGMDTGCSSDDAGQKEPI